MFFTGTWTSFWINNVALKDVVEFLNLKSCTCLNIFHLIFTKWNTSRAIFIGILNSSRVICKTCVIHLVLFNSIIFFWTNGGAIGREFRRTDLRLTQQSIFWRAKLPFSAWQLISGVALTNTFWLWENVQIYFLCICLQNQRGTGALILPPISIPSMRPQDQMELFGGWCLQTFFVFLWICWLTWVIFLNFFGVPKQTMPITTRSIRTARPAPFFLVVNIDHTFLIGIILETICITWRRHKLLSRVLCIGWGKE